MTGDNITKILDIKVNYGKAIEALSRYRTTLDQIKEAEKQLRDELKSGAIAQQDYQKQMSALDQEKKHAQASTRDLTRVIQNNIKVENEQRNSMRSMRAELSNLTRQYDMLSASARNGLQGAKLKAQINDLTKSIKDAEMATQRFYRNVGNYQSALLAVKELGGAFHTFGGIVATALGGIGLDQFANTMVNVAKDFEDAMARVRAVGNPDEGEFKQLREKALELGRDTKFTATQVGDAMEELARKGFKAAEVTTMVGHVLKQAQANVTSMADAAQVTSSTLRAFDLEVEETGRVVDVLSSACANSGTNLTQLGEAMKTAGPSAKAANVSLEETTALIGSLANVGMTGSDAGTGVKQIIMAMATMAKSTDKAREVLKHYNLEITEARMRNGELMDMLREMAESGIGNSIGDLKLVSGKYASPRLANLINNVDDAIALNDVLKNSIGENERMYNESIGKTSDALFKLKSAWENMLIGMYDSSSKYLVEPIKWLTEAIKFASENVRLFGQTFTSILVALMANPAWKGLKTMGGVIATSWQTAKAGAMTAMGEIDASVKALQKDREVLKKRELQIEAQINQEEKALGVARTADSIAQAELRSAKITLIHQRMEKRLSWITEREAAQRVGASRNALAMIDAKYKQELVSLNAAFQEENATTIRTAEETARLRIEAEERVTAVYKEQAAVRSGIAKTEGAIQAQLTTKRAMQQTTPNLTVWGKFWSGCKTGFSFVAGIFKSIGSMLKSFLPFMIMFGVMEFIQGIQRALELMSLVEDKMEEAKNKLKEATTGADDPRLTGLRAMKDLLNDINKEQNMYKKLSEESYKQLRAIGHRLKLSKEAQADIDKALTKQNKNLTFQKKTYLEIKKALDDRIKAETNSAQRKALTGIITESQQTLIKTGIKMAVKGEKGEQLSDPNTLIEGIRKIWNSKGTGSQLWAQLQAYVGEDSLYAMQREAEAAFSAYNWAMRELKKLPDYTKDLIETTLGDYNPSDIGSGRGGSKKEYNYASEIAKWQKANDDVDARVETDLENAEIQKAQNRYLAKLHEWNKFIEQNPDANKNRPDQWKELTKLIDRYFENAPAAEQKEVEDIMVKFLDKTADETINYINGLLNETDIYRSSTKGKDGRRQYLNLYKRQEYEQTIANEENRKAERGLEMTYLRGGYGKTKGQGSYKDQRKTYKEYEEMRDELEEKLFNNEITQEAYERQVAEWDKEWHAEQEYYNRRLLLASEYERKINELSVKYFAEEHKINMQREQNQLELHRLMYEAMLDQTHDYYAELQHLEKDELQVGSDELNKTYVLRWHTTEDYWNKLGDNIGEFEAKILQSEYNVAKENLQGIINQGWDESAESFEEYQGRLIEAQARMQEIHTKANEAMEQSDMTRLQATQTVTDGLIKLAEELEQEDKGAAKLAKTLALFNIMVNTAEAIAKMTSREAGKGIIGIATTAAGVAAILANMASAMSILNQAKFAKGAVNIGGAGSETSDSIPARISRGESVMNAKATKMFEPILIAMNNIGNGVALPRNNYVQTQQTADMTDAFSAAASKIRPVVDVREVTRVQNRVQTLETLDSL